MNNYMKSCLWVIVLVCASPTFSQDFTSNLVAYYPFNSNTNDAVGSLNGTLIGNTTLTSDRFNVPNKAYFFDGNGDFIRFSAAPMTIVNNWTIAAWVHPSVLNQLSMVVDVGFNDCFGVPSCGYGFGMGNGGITGNAIQGSFGFVAFINSGATFSQSNIWYHIVMLRQSGTTKFYLNGAQTSMTSTSTPLTPIGFIIGAEEGSGGTGCRFWNGKIDEVRVYNRALTDADILALYGAESVLPIELTYFKATPKNQMIQLDWQTALEQNADLFDIERSADGQYFEKIASVKAVNKANIYNFVDEHPLSNLSYYRLKQMDTNHKFTYSNTISVVFGKTKTLKVYPNPSTNDFTIELPLAEEKLSIAVFDATGKLVFKEHTEGGRFLKIATNNWLSGIYILKINNQNNCWTERLTKF